MEKILLIFSFLVFTSYVISITLKFGWLRSISSSWYYIKRKYLFTLSLWGFSIPLAIAGDTALFFLAASGICFAGAAADTNHEKMTDAVHIVGATGGIILGMLGLLTYGMWYFVLVQLVFTLLTMNLNLRNHTFWIETMAFYFIWTGIMIHIF